HPPASIRLSVLVLSRLAALRALHSFPTRRSSDLDDEQRGPRLIRGTDLIDEFRFRLHRNHVADDPAHAEGGEVCEVSGHVEQPTDRKSTRLNSSHVSISYAVFCVKKKHPSRYRRT